MGLSSRQFIACPVWASDNPCRDEATRARDGVGAGLAEARRLHDAFPGRESDDEREAATSNVARRALAKPAAKIGERTRIITTSDLMRKRGTLVR